MSSAIEEVDSGRRNGVKSKTRDRFPWCSLPYFFFLPIPLVFVYFEWREHRGGWRREIFQTRIWPQNAWNESAGESGGCADNSSGIFWRRPVFFLAFTSLPELFKEHFTFRPIEAEPIIRTTSQSPEKLRSPTNTSTTCRQTKITI